MPDGPIRRAQLVTPSGVASLMVARNGFSLICCGLDHWYEREDGTLIDVEEYRIQEWRLEEQLGVSHFRLPPDYREAWRFDASQSVQNCNVTVPFQRFPQCHQCPGCDRLDRVSLSRRGPAYCPDCEKQGKKRRMEQVRFIAVCDAGHIQDFPWTEWVHGKAGATCPGVLKLRAVGAGATLAAQMVECSCGKKRSLAEAVFGDPTTTGLSKNLEKGTVYFCRGERPWLGYEPGEEREQCDRPLNFSLRNAINVYYPNVRSSIFLPRSSSNAPEALVTLFQNPPFSTIIALLRGDDEAPITPKRLRKNQSKLLEPYGDEQIDSALKIILNPQPSGQRYRVQEDTPATAFRREEYDVLREDRTETDLKIRRVNMAEYDSSVAFLLQRLTLLDKLRETAAFAGFNRIRDSQRTAEESQRWLWRSVPGTPEETWLPAYVVRGEGIYIELDETYVRNWESRPTVQQRVEALCERYRVFRSQRGFEERSVGPRYLLIHTLAHLLINRLTFECGYSSAALRERLYVSDHPSHPMAGVLIYTASGDADGTMGGLVRMGKSGSFEPVLRRAVETAQWCSSDPICMEMADRGGQGPDSCNLAACHSCALLPETACEEFNRLLDRALVVGSLKDPSIGFFRPLLDSQASTNTTLS